MKTADRLLAARLLKPGKIPLPLPAAAIGKGRARMPAAGMNRLESRYAGHLEAERLAGRVLWYSFEAIKFRLAASTFYTPDFVVMLADCSIELHEVKGFWEDDARVKIKVAAAAYPFRFLGVTASKSGWSFEDFPSV